MPRPSHALQALALIAVVLGARPSGATAPVTPPAPARFVTDGAQFLSPGVADQLDRRLSDYQRGTGHQVLLWIGHTTNGEPIETWAVRTFAAWRVGRQGIDDGVALFVMADDRKLRIEVGYGVEERLPDVRAARIIREQITPRLQAGDRDGAARAGVGAILEALGGTGATAAEGPAAGRPHLGLGEMIVLGILGLFVLGFIVTHPGLALLLLTNMGSGGRRSGDGSGWGGGSGGGGFSGGGGRSGGGGASGSW